MVDASVVVSCSTIALVAAGSAIAEASANEASTAEASAAEASANEASAAEASATAGSTVVPDDDEVVDALTARGSTRLMRAPVQAPMTTAYAAKPAREVMTSGRDPFATAIADRTPVSTRSRPYLERAHTTCPV